MECYISVTVLFSFIAASTLGMISVCFHKIRYCPVSFTKLSLSVIICVVHYKSNWSLLELTLLSLCALLHPVSVPRWELLDPPEKMKNFLGWDLGVAFQPGRHQKIDRGWYESSTRWTDKYRLTKRHGKSWVNFKN